MNLLHYEPWTVGGYFRLGQVRVTVMARVKDCWRNISIRRSFLYVLVLLVMRYVVGLGYFRLG